MELKLSGVGSVSGQVDQIDFKGNREIHLKEKRDGAIETFNMRESFRATKSDQKTKNLITKMNETMKILEIERKYYMEKLLKQVVVKFIDIKESKVIEQIPPEEVIVRYHKMMAFLEKLSKQFKNT